MSGSIPLEIAQKGRKPVYKNSESSPEQSNTVLVDLEPESAQTCIEHAIVFRATTVPAGSDVDVVVDRGDPDTVSSSFPFSRRLLLLLLCEAHADRSMNTLPYGSC